MPDRERQLRKEEQGSGKRDKQTTQQHEEGGGTDSPEPVYGQKSQVPTSHPVRQKRAGVVDRERMIRPKGRPAQQRSTPSSRLKETRDNGQDTVLG